VQRIIPMR